MVMLKKMERENRAYRSMAARLFLVSLLAFIIGLAFGMGKIVRDCSLTCNVGYKLTPIAIIAVGLVAVPLSSSYLRLSNRLGYERWQILSFFLIAISFFAFWVATRYVLTILSDTTLPSSSTAIWTFPLGFIYLCFYVWLGALGATIRPNIKSTIYRLFSLKDQAKALAITTAAIIVGGILGAFLSSLIAPAVMTRFEVRYELARDSLILIMGFLMLLPILIIWIIDRFSIISAQEQIDVPPGMEMDPEYQQIRTANLRQAIRTIGASQKLKRMAYLIVTTGIAESIMIYLFYWLITEQVPGSTGRTAFFADFYIWLNACTLLFLIFGTNRLINRFGLVLALLSLPIALFLGSLYLFAQSIIIAIYILRISYSAIEQSLYGQGIDRLILEVPMHMAALVRPVLHGLAIRVGRGVGAVLVLVLAVGAGLSFSHITVVFIVVICFWISIVVSLRGQLGT